MPDLPDQDNIPSGADMNGDGHLAMTESSVQVSMFDSFQTEQASPSPLTYLDIAGEVSNFSYLFRLKHKINRQPRNFLLLEDIEKDMDELCVSPGRRSSF